MLLCERWRRPTPPIGLPPEEERGPRCARRAGGRLEELAEIVDREPGVAHDAAHGVGVDRVGSWDRENPRPVGHDHVLALAKNPKARLLQRANGLLVRNTRKLRQGSDRDVDFADRGVL